MANIELHLCNSNSLLHCMYLQNRLFIFYLEWEPHPQKLVILNVSPGYF